jgi:predicted Zn-dependent protease
MPRRVLWIVLVVLVLVLTACTSVEERRTRVLEQSTTALDRGDATTAVALLESSLRYDPRDPVLRHRLAEVHLHLGNAYDAWSALAERPGDAPTAPGTTTLEAQILLECDRPYEALPRLLALERRGEADPQMVNRLLDQLARRGGARSELPAPWRRRLVHHLLAAHQGAAAVETWRRLPPEDAQRPALFEHILELLLRSPEGDEVLRSLRELDDADASAPVLLARHRRAVLEGNGGTMERIEERFLTLYPNHPDRYPIVLARTRRALRRNALEEALGLARQAATLAPQRPEPLLEEAFALRALDRPDEARRSLEMVLALDPNNATALGLLRTDAEGGTAPVVLRVEASH